MIIILYYCSLGYKPFMLAIQNQISVLSTILATKIQHEQILEHQRVISATLSKVSVAPIPRSRKSSANQSETNSKDRLSVTSVKEEQDMSQLSANSHDESLPQREALRRAPSPESNCTIS